MFSIQTSSTACFFLFGGGTNDKSDGTNPPDPVRAHDVTSFSRTQLFRTAIKVGLKALYEIAKVKHAERHSVLLPLESVCKSVRATALSMGLEIVDDRESLKKTNSA